MNAKTVQKYKKYSTPKLIDIAQRHFNKYIRLRDAEKPCISCGRRTTLQAGHYYPAGQYKLLRFDENNTFGECVHCNYYSGDHLIKFRENMITRIGEEAVEQLDRKAGISKRDNSKWDRFTLIEVIEKYKQLNKLR